MNTLAVITARQGSTRLPNKALADICGKPMLQRIVDRVRKSSVNKTVVATSVNSLDIIQYCKAHRIPYYAGEEYNICDRLFQTVKKFNADVFVYIWGDSPLIEAKDINYALMMYSFTSPSYLTYETNGGIIAISSLARLSEAWNKKWAEENIHEYLSRTEEASVLIVGIPITVDTQEDLEKVRRIYADM